MKATIFSLCQCKDASQLVSKLRKAAQIQTKAMSTSCKMNSDSFCYVCAKFKPKRGLVRLTPALIAAYESYFNRPVENQSENWVPHTCCMRCAVILRESSHGKPRSLPFSVPALWTKPENHHNDCYFCRCKFTGFGKDYCDKVVYPRVDSVKQPAKHAIVVSQCAGELSAGELDNETDEDSREDPSHSLYEPTDSESKYISQPRLNDIARDLGLSKDQSELLASRLQELKLLDSSARVSYFRTRNSVFCQFFAESESVCYCCDIPGLFDAVGCAFDPADWRLFTDGSKYSLKAALVHNGNALPSLPVAYSAQLSER